jgi:hypothetical protein
VLESLPLQELHADEGLPLVLVDVVDRADVGVVKRGGGTSLALEPLPGLGAGEVPLGEELQRHPAAQAGVLSLVDDTHTAAPDLAPDSVVRNGLADHGWT